MAKTANTVTETTATENTPVSYTLEEVRNKKAKINIILPAATNVDDNSVEDRYETVTVNGKNIQIKRGEPVAVNWPTFEALINSKRYTSAIMR